MKTELIINIIILIIALLFAVISWVLVGKIKRNAKKPTEQPPFIVEERKIQKIRSVHIITSYEAQIFPLDEIKLAVATVLLKEMLKVGAIKFEYFDLPSGEKRIEAITYVPEKL